MPPPGLLSTVGFKIPPKPLVVVPTLTSTKLPPSSPRAVPLAELQPLVRSRAAELIPRYEAVDPAEANAWLRGVFSTHPATVLDIGAGSGCSQLAPSGRVPLSGSPSRGPPRPIAALRRAVPKASSCCALTFRCREPGQPKAISSPGDNRPRMGPIWSSLLPRRSFRTTFKIPVKPACCCSRASAALKAS